VFPLDTGFLGCSNDAREAQCAQMIPEDAIIPRVWVRNEWVYAMFCEAPSSPVGWVKIGITENILGRIGSIKHGTPFPINMIALVGCTEDGPPAARVEQRLHERFALRRCNGEWFQFNFSDSDDKRDFNDGCREVFRELWGENYPWWWKTSESELRRKLRDIGSDKESYKMKMACSQIHRTEI